MAKPKTIKGEKLKFIRQIIPLRNSVLAVQFDDGSTGTVDFKPLIRRGDIYKPLADAAFFAKVRIARGGYTIRWSEMLEFDADALYLRAEKSQKSFVPARKSA